MSANGRKKTIESAHYFRLKCEKATRLVDPRTLTKHQRHTLWQGIKLAEPALADLLSNDPTYLALIETFNSSVRFEIDDFNRFIQAGQEREK